MTRNLIMNLQDTGTTAKYLIRDRDSEQRGLLVQRERVKHLRFHRLASRGHRQLAGTAWSAWAWLGPGRAAAVDLWCGQSGGCDRARDLVLGGESDGHFATVLVGVEVMTAWSKVR